MMKKISKYIAVANINFLTTLAYPVEILARLPVYMILLWMLSQLYGAVYKQSPIDVISGFTFTHTMWTLMFVNAFSLGTFLPIIKTISTEVISGTLAYTINKPYSYILFHLSSFLGNALPRVILSLFFGVITMQILVGSADLSLINICLGLFLMLLGFTLNFFIRISLGLFAFWIENTEPLDWIIGKTNNVFGGLYIPLAFFSGFLKSLALSLPFAFITYAPSEFIVKGTMDDFLNILLMQLFWLTVLGVFSLYIFKKGIKNVSIHGG